MQMEDVVVGDERPRSQDGALPAPKSRNLGQSQSQAAILDTSRSSSSTATLRKSSLVSREGIEGRNTSLSARVTLSTLIWPLSGIAIPGLRPT